jgi:uncharacterized Zn-finger protein
MIDLNRFGGRDSARQPSYSNEKTAEERLGDTARTAWGHRRVRRIRYQREFFCPGSRLPSAVYAVVTARQSQKGPLLCERLSTTRNPEILMAEHVIPHFHNDPGVPVIEIGAKEFMCVGATPPHDHPHVFLDMGDENEIVCSYCSTLYRFVPALDSHAARPAECALPLAAIG